MSIISSKKQAMSGKIKKEGHVIEIQKSNLTRNESETRSSEPMRLRKRASTQRSDGFKLNAETHNSDEDFIVSKKKRQMKKKAAKVDVAKPEKTSQNAQRQVPEGVSVFDLIMPWKTEVEFSKPLSSQSELNKVINFSQKTKLESVDYSKHANDVQAILVNPPWEQTRPLNSKKSAGPRISIEDFKNNFKIPTSVLKDGLVFIWVEKDIISDLIKVFEAQDFTYVENVCYIMLDQNIKA